MKTGRNLNIISGAIIVYLLSGAEFQSLGVSGLSWEIAYPGVVKLAAIVLWFWMILLHWLISRKGEYYEAFVLNTYDKNRDGVQFSEDGVSQDDVDPDIASVEAYYAKRVHDFTMNHPFCLACVTDKERRRGIYVSQRKSIATSGPNPGQEHSAWHDFPVSTRYSLIHLHYTFPTIVWRILRNNPEVFADRIVPWGFSVITVILLITNYATDVSAWSALIFENATPPSSTIHW